MKKNSFITILLTAGIAAFAAGAAHAAIIIPALPGVSKYDQWDTLDLTTANNPGYGIFPGVSDWPGAILSGANTSGSTPAGLRKISSANGGGAFPAGSSLYYGGFSSNPNTDGGTLGVFDNSPVAGLETIVFQIKIGEASGYDFYNGVNPALFLNGGALAYEATYSALLEQEYAGTFDAPTGTEPLYNNLYAFQWDLRDFTDPISSFEIQWNGVQHAQIYGLRLDQSDEFLQVVPEPSTALLIGITGTLAFFSRRRRNSEKIKGLLCLKKS